MADEIILAQEQFSDSGWTDYGANYFLNRISTISNGSTATTGFSCKFYYRNSGSNDLFSASNLVNMTLFKSVDGVRSAQSSIDLSFLSGLSFDELYFVVFYNDPVISITAPCFIKKVDNTAYVDGGLISINNFKIGFVNPDPTAPFEFPELDPFAVGNVQGRFVGGGSFLFGVPVGIISVQYTGGGSFNFIEDINIVNGVFTGGGFADFDIATTAIKARYTGGGFLNFDKTVRIAQGDLTGGGLFNFNTQGFIGVDVLYTGGGSFNSDQTLLIFNADGTFTGDGRMDFDYAIAISDAQFTGSGLYNFDANITRLPNLGFNTFTGSGSFTVNVIQQIQLNIGPMTGSGTLSFVLADPSKRITESGETRILEDGTIRIVNL